MMDRMGGKSIEELLKPTPEPSWFERLQIKVVPAKIEIPGLPANNWGIQPLPPQQIIIPKIELKILK